MFNRLPQNQIQVSLAQLLGTAAPNYTILLIGHLLTANAPVPVPGYDGPALEFYKPYQLPSFPSVDATMQWLKDNGLAVNFGITQSIDLGVPDTVTINVDSSVTLTWTVRPTGFDNLRKNAVGTVDQATSLATGTYAGYGATGYSILVADVTGVFDTTHAVTVTTTQASSSVINAVTSDEVACMIFNALQASSGAAVNNAATPNIYFAMLKSTDTGFGPALSGVWSYVLSRPTWYTSILIPYEILTTDDITINYVDFFTAILTLNAPTNVNQQKYGTIGYWAVSSVDKDSISDLVMKDSQYFGGIYFPYDNTSNIVTQLPGQIVSSAITYVATNPPPYNTLDRVEINGLIPPDSVDEGISYDLGEDVLAKGYTPIFIDENKLPAFVRTITGLLTYPNTTDPANQYYDIQNWQVIIYNRETKGVILASDEFINQKFTAIFSKNLRNKMIQVDKIFERASMIANVSVFQSQYTVTQDANTGVVTVTNPLEVTAGVQNIIVDIALQNQFGNTNV